MAQVWRPKKKTDNDGYFDVHFARPSNDYGAGVPLSDSATSEAMRRDDRPGDVATKLGEGLYVAQRPPPSQVGRKQRARAGARDTRCCRRKRGVCASEALRKSRVRLNSGAYAPAEGCAFGKGRRAL